MNDRDRLVELLGNKIIKEIKKYKIRGFPSLVIDSLADNLIENGVTIPVRCRECKHFMEYTDESAKIFKANGDCLIRKMNSYDEEFSRCEYDDYCSYGHRKENGNE